MDRERRRRRRPQADHRADLRGKGFVCLPHAVVDSYAYQSLSALARAILVEIARKLNGYNNGELGIGQRELGRRLGRQNYQAFARAIAELVSVGLIDVELEGSWKPRKAREYRLTFCSSGKGGCRPASNEYFTINPEKVGDEDASAVRATSAEASSAARKFRDEVGLATITEDKGKVASATAEDGSSHILSHPNQQGARRNG